MSFKEIAKKVSFFAEQYLNLGLEQSDIFILAFAHISVNVIHRFPENRPVALIYVSF